MNYKIALIKGDGIGPEIVDEAVKVLDRVGVSMVIHLLYKSTVGRRIHCACGVPER